MRVFSGDGRKSIDLGDSNILQAVYNTAIQTFKRNRKTISAALDFMETGKCLSSNGYITARQFNLIRDAFASIPPEQVVYDINDRKKKAPWDRNISPVITSCANLFTSSEGGDWLFEVVSMLVYGQIAETDIFLG